MKDFIFYFKGESPYIFNHNTGLDANLSKQIIKYIREKKESELIRFFAFSLVLLYKL